MTDGLSSWIAPEGAVVPDFIICGAMKCGTSSLHKILNCHPGVFIPDGEMGFFDIDDVFQHYTYNFFNGDQWFSQDFESCPERFWQWYTTFFSNAGKEQLVGEDSTTYFTSDRAIERITRQKKRVRLIVMLRHPTDRAYSQYWHMVRAGLMSSSFEDAIQFEPATVLERSLYLKHLRRALRYVEKGDLKIVIFEDFVRYPMVTVSEICKFLGIEAERFPESSVQIHENRSIYPKHVRLRLLRNKLLRSAVHRPSFKNFPLPSRVDNKRSGSMLRGIDVLHRFVNPDIAKACPPMHQATRSFLNSFFWRELRGLDECAGLPLLEKWFSHESDTRVGAGTGIEASVAV